MKALFLLLALTAAASLAGCADPTEKRTSQEVGSQIQKGVSGQGAIGPEQREPGDPANEHGVPQTHP